MSAGISLHRDVHAELDELVAREVLTREQAVKLKDRYPAAPRGLGFLVTVFAALGGIAAAAGAGVLLQEHLLALWSFLKERINWWLAAEFSLLLAFVSLLLEGRQLRCVRSRPLPGEICELAGAFALQGLTAVMARHYSTGSDNWPALLGMDAALLLLLAYALGNRLVLWYALADLFFFFGAETGYVSGWGAYYLGMTYPVRFLGIGLLTLAAAWAHGLIVRGRLTNFSRVYAHYGLLLTNLSLWFLSLFGYFENAEVRWEGTSGERLIFTFLWGLASVSSLLAGAKTGLRLLRGYGLTFLIINVYTFYFQFVAANTGEAWFIHLLVIGGSLLFLGFHMETVKSAAMPGEVQDD
ncbi:MAG TPA: hypothetical protein PKI19_08990 [Elusimicrobiales bacterium]|nr:hypothetical protein [Elusimicrobiales bacterium]